MRMVAMSEMINGPACQCLDWIAYLERADSGGAADEVVFTNATEAAAFNANPDAYAAKHFGLSVEEYREWTRVTHMGPAKMAATGRRVGQGALESLDNSEDDDATVENDGKSSTEIELGGAPLCCCRYKNGRLCKNYVG